MESARPSDIASDSLSATTTTQNPLDHASGYTAVVYFHGIGSQRRYSEMSRLVEALDRYSFLQLGKPTGRQSGLRATEVQLEPSRTNEDLEVAYLSLKQYRQGEGEVAFRFYEGYWAPITAGVVNAREVAYWMLRHSLTPLRLLATPWRSHARLRRASLFQVASVWTKTSQPSHRALKRLLAGYDDFEGLEARRDLPKGRFGDFTRLLADGSKSEETILGARRWRRHYRASLLTIQFVVLTLMLSLALGAIAALSAITMVLDWASATSLASDQGVRSLVEPTPANIAAISAILLGVTGVASFLRNVVGDVLLWATYEETDAKHDVRQRILDSGRDLLRHVITDPDCSRVVVVGHSLGSTIAYDCLLALGQYYRARPSKGSVTQPDHKFDHFVTIGSPIDTVHTIFESHRGTNHRYNRVFESVRGDMGEVPFSFRKKPRIHWVNFWDPADPIGGPLFTPNQKRGRILPIDNFEVRSLTFPSPAESHSAYFEHDELLGHLFDMIFLGKYSFHNPGSPALHTLHTQPRAGRIMLFQVVMLALPWLVTAYILSILLDVGSIAATSILVMVSAALLLVVAGWLDNVLKGNRHSIWRNLTISSP